MDADSNLAEHEARGRTAAASGSGRRPVKARVAQRAVTPVDAEGAAAAGHTGSELAKSAAGV